MSSDSVAISIRGLSKSYKIAHNAVRHSTLADAVYSRLRRPFQPRSVETFWALKDVSFDIKKGDVVGIIGRNGAGKSTLLKILSRITEPTTGEIDLFGRVGSLLEVGTGFHQDLTGRENIFLNGAILGMTRAEIRRQFDAIVDFAGTEQFLDTPVKRYSSGMFVRLAFAVAAHLNPEILIVDEVLAVGDAEFQKKCLGKIRSVASDGRTVLFVSHQMHSIATLCTSAIWLGAGKIVASGSAASIIEKYSEVATQELSQPPVPIQFRRGTGEYRFVDFCQLRAVYHPAEEKSFSFRLSRQSKDLGAMYVSALLFDAQGLEIAQFDSRLLGYWLGDAGSHDGQFSFDSPWLKPGTYRIDAYLCTNSSIIDCFENACTFEVSSVLPYPNTASINSTASGVVLPSFKWASRVEAKIDATAAELQSDGDRT